jgi:predicted outer membrane repeat protein
LGGAASNEGQLTFNQSTVDANEANGAGAIFNEHGLLVIEDSTFSNNIAGVGNGGAIYNEDGVVTSDNSTFARNLADDEGGAFYQDGGSTILKNSTVGRNSAGVGGGGIRNTGGTVTLENSMVAATVAGGDCSGAIASGDYNLDSDNSCNLIAPGDVPNSDPLLGPLQDNGGDTFTLALQDGSPAIDAGSCPGTLADQRGFWRPVDRPGIVNVEDGCDIGAFEVQVNVVYFPVVSRP